MRTTDHCVLRPGDDRRSADRIFAALFFLFTLCYCLPSAVFAQGVDYTKWVDPFIGTGGHGHTFPGATMPFGMVQLSPDTRIDNWDGSSGYHYSDDTIYGFSHTHLNGTGIPDGCDILFMPKADDSIGSQMDVAKFSHSNEKAEPGYYSVKLDDSNILAELTATTRVGFHRYTFPAGKTASILFDLNWRDKVLDSDVKVTANGIEGFRQSTSWANDQKIYFVAMFSKISPYKDVIMSTELPENREDGSSKKQKLRGLLKFDIKPGEKILVKVAISNVSIEGARKNLEAELPGWDFDKVRADARAAWNKELSKIEVSGGTDAQTKNFYTAMYHTMIQPNTFSDVDGRYRGMDGKIHALSPGFSRLPAGETPPKGGSPSVQYSVFSLWDTFRAAHPLYTITDERRTAEFINTFIRQYEQGGRLPVWELWGNETDCMIGYHAVSVIADAMMKGIKGFDYEKAYAAAKHSAELDRDGLAAYKKRGYISSEDENESVSRTLEYAYDDWCIAQMARLLNKPEEAKHFDDRARSFENVFDPSVGFMRPKKNGHFLSPFAPNEVTFNFTEGNSWVYSFFVPQDVSRLIELQGGREKFAAKLDELFNTTDKLTGREQPDITGLIGQYAHGNEPSHHIAYLYDYAGQPWKTQALVRRIMDEFYKPEPDGLIGNEDCGQMSAWYILSASGFYPVTPGSNIYAIGTPLFKEVKYHLENGKTFTIRAPKVSDKNIYILNAKLNGSPYKKAFITHDDIRNGGTLEFAMIDSAVETAFTEFPVSSMSNAFVAVPEVIGDTSFSKETTISMKLGPSGEKIYYTTDGTTPSLNSTRYTMPFKVMSDTDVKAFAVDNKGVKSSVVQARFHKNPNDRAVRLGSRYSYQYTGGGDDAVIDGIRGTANYTSGAWQGFQGKAFEAVVDLKRATTFSEVGAGFLQSSKAWIWLPAKLTVEASDDGVNFRSIGSVSSPMDQRNEAVEIHDMILKLSQPVTARFIRLRADNIGKIPSWHPGSGGDPWIFVDEVIVK